MPPNGFSDVNESKMRRRTAWNACPTPFKVNIMTTIRNKVLIFRSNHWTPQPWPFSTTMRTIWMTMVISKMLYMIWFWLASLKLHCHSFANFWVNKSSSNFSMCVKNSKTRKLWFYKISLVEDCEETYDTVRESSLYEIKDETVKEGTEPGTQSSGIGKNRSSKRMRRKSRPTLTRTRSMLPLMMPMLCLASQKIFNSKILLIVKNE